MRVNFFKYQGNGNDFIIIDSRINFFPEKTSLISSLCDRKFGIGSDGLIIIKNDNNLDFFMKYFNSNGIEGSMCGNGARCAVAFSKKIGIIFKKKTCFHTIDGKYYAFIDKNKVSLKMKDISIIKIHSNYVFLNTGSPHHIVFVKKNIDKINVVQKGRLIRYGPPYFNNGTNVNFVKIIENDSLYVRTYERGVENETLSCGTGVTASVLASYYTKKIKNNIIKVYTRGGKFLVNFQENKGIFKEIWLHGKVSYIFEGFIDII